MTVRELFVSALEIAGYSENECLGANDIKDKMLSIVNTVCSDIIFSKGATEFKKILNEDDDIGLNDKEAYDCAVYGVAALIQNILGSSYDFEVFERIYKNKKNLLLRKCEIYQVKDTFGRDVMSDE
ncbi:MAG: hypothetical protein IIU65_04350 [Clostridia bacterium]|nr:hypothetical protein [Clostridia bacterium]